MHDTDVDEVMRAYGARKIDAVEAAERVRPAYAYALAEQAARDPHDPDAASTPHAFHGVGLARITGAISMDQYVALTEALQLS